jgi:hypothetical protein
MSQIFVWCISFISAAIFDRLPVQARVTAMRREMADSLAVMQSGDLSDDEKQKKLLSISGRMLILTAQLALLLGLVVVPFAVVSVVERCWLSTLSISAMLLTVHGMAFGLLGFLSYYLIKKAYARFRL